MPFIPAQLAVADIDSDILDLARDVYRKEVSRWRIVGPAKTPVGESWLASRNSEAALAELAPTAEIAQLNLDPDIEAMEFSEKGYAMGFVMWRALGKAIAFYNSKSRPAIIGLTR